VDNDNMQSYSINVFGAGGVGKTSWVNKMCSRPHVKNYVATVGCKTSELTVQTNYGTIVLKFNDYAGQELFSTTPIKACDMSILMFDYSSKGTHSTLEHWFPSTGTEPVVIVGNKFDINKSTFTPTFHTTHGLPLLSVSAKTMTASDLLTPLLRSVTAHADLELVTL
jgi:GTPase SAR1 family protein